jgi:LysM repeat protein
MIATMPPPPPATVVVQAGQTLSGIGERYGVPLQTIEERNPQIANPSSIYVGEVVSVGGEQPQQLPQGFTIKVADGVTYVCSTQPVQCTGNAPKWADAPKQVSPETKPKPVEASNPPADGQAQPSAATTPSTDIPAWASCIVERESGGNPRSVNAVPGWVADGGGLFGDLRTTWNGYDGYPQPFDAPVSVQIQFNDQLSDNGANLLPWAADKCPGT